MPDARCASWCLALLLAAACGDDSSGDGGGTGATSGGVAADTEPDPDTDGEADTDTGVATADDDDDDDDDADGTTTGGPPDTADDTSDTSGGASEDGDSGGEGGATFPTCTLTCEAPTDCGPPGQKGAFDSDNWACSDGVCVYAGCNSDDECIERFGDFVCRDDERGVGQCVPSCARPADCPLGGPNLDEDNWACEEGICVNTGCNSDAECEWLSMLELGDWVCAPVAGGVDACVLTCDTPDDCGSGTPSNDADNYSCDEGICVYNGCNDDRECARNQVCV